MRWQSSVCRTLLSETAPRTRDMRCAARASGAQQQSLLVEMKQENAASEGTRLNAGNPDLAVRVTALTLVAHVRFHDELRRKSGAVYQTVRQPLRSTHNGAGS